MRFVVVPVVFLVFAVVAAKLVFAHGIAGGGAAGPVRLASWMAGLFAGGIAAVVAGIAVWRAGKS